MYKEIKVNGISWTLWITTKWKKHIVECHAVHRYNRWGNQRQTERYETPEEAMEDAMEYIQANSTEKIKYKFLLSKLDKFEWSADELTDIYQEIEHRLSTGKYSDA